MRISILHPSRSRPQQARNTAIAWLTSAKYKDSVEYIFSLDNDDPNLNSVSDIHSNYTETLFYVFKRTGGHVISIKNNNKSAIEAINKAAEICTGDLIIAVSDDFNTPPFHWDEALRTALEGKRDFLVKTNDTLQPWIITLPIMDRVYYERFGYVYDPRFSHLFCDTALTHIGHMLGRVIELPIMFKHNHYTQKGGQPKDAINEKNDKTWAQGEKLYLELLMRNFDLPPEQIVSNGNFDESHRRWLLSKGIRYEKL